MTDATYAPSVPVSVMLPTFQRVEALLNTLEHLQKLRSRAAEIIVHVDGGDKVSGHALQENCPDVTVLQSKERVGPGGGRNRMLEAAAHPLVVSLDDHSYPVDEDFLEHVSAVMKAQRW